MEEVQGDSIVVQGAKAACDERRFGLGRNRFGRHGIRNGMYLRGHEARQGVEAVEGSSHAMVISVLCAPTSFASGNSVGGILV